MQPKLLGLFLVDVVPGMTPQLPDLNGNTNPNPWKTSVPEDSYAVPLLRLLHTSATDAAFYVLVLVVRVLLVVDGSWTEFAYCSRCWTSSRF